MSLTLNEEQKRFLLYVARTAAQCYLDHTPTPSFEAQARRLGVDRQCGGCFVTYENDGRLRGCIGIFTPDEPLYEVVESRAVETLSDDRFKKISSQEFRNQIDICISVLTPPVKIIDPLRQVRVGEHGIIVTKGWRSGTYLPQVATDNNWDVRTFVTHCATNKAGISGDVLRDPAITWQTYTAILMYEKELGKGTP
ncbi:AMMECR1 protein [Pelomyxa schiedti]|nr:AMMECR1 protein [Pelomyxa schiedti]